VSRASRILIINADDFGYASSVNEGVVEAHRRGVVTATTWLAAGAAAAEAARLAANTPTLDVGLHLALSELPPCAPAASVRSLLYGGRLPRSYAGVVRRLVRRPDAVRAAETEWRAQYAAFSEHFGGPPSHVDSHQHVAMAPPLWNVFLRLAVEHGVSFVRVPQELSSPASLVRPPGTRRLPAALVLSALARAFRRRVRARGLRTTDRFSGFRVGGRATRADLLDLAAHVADGVTEWMVHPGTADTVDGCRRAAEMAALVDPSLRDALTERGVRLASFRELAATRG
jgi:predicted glycoside hydrolase/deacetylase ChbG (UPF0249 family)